MRASRATLIIAAGAVAAGWAAAAWTQPADARPPPVIRISASAEVSVSPDRAVVRLGVLGEGADAAAAQGRVNATMAAILDAMRALELPDRALRTSDLSLYPVYADQRARSGDEPQPPTIVGYRASNVVSVEVAELARIGEVIDAGIEAGANQLQGISFSARNDAGARAQAMRLAIEEARIQADAIAEALGVRITGVREVVAGEYGVRPPMPYAEARFSAEMAATPIQPGQVDITANVAVTYEIDPSGQ